MTVELTGRIPSKKNSKRIFRNRSTGRTIIASSSAYTTWHQEQLLRLRLKRPKQPLTGSLSLTLHLYLKGRIDQDLDNAVASVLDPFQDAGVIENDKQVTELHLYKHGGQSHFSASVSVESMST